MRDCVRNDPLHVSQCARYLPAKLPGYGTKKEDGKEIIKNLYCMKIECRNLDTQLFFI